MGGEFGPPVVVPALIACLRNNTSVTALIFGDKQAIDKELVGFGLSSVRNRMTVIHCAEVVSDFDRPSVAVRSKRDSSMGRAVKAVAEQDAEIGRAHV